jgi:hypothetical protein
LKTRCKAIQRALAKYNTAAKVIGRPALDWSAISQYGSLAEFELLRECRNDIRALPWADSTNCQAAIYELKIERAQEERNRLNVEIQRLVTSMKDEEQHFAQCIKALASDSALLGAELSMMLARRCQVHNINLIRISKIYNLKSYTGSQDPGTAVRKCHGAAAAEALDEENPDDYVFAADEDDVVGDQLDSLTTYLESLSLDSAQD